MEFSKTVKRGACEAALMILLAGGTVISVAHADSPTLSDDYPVFIMDKNYVNVVLGSTEQSMSAYSSDSSYDQALKTVNGLNVINEINQQTDLNTAKKLAIKDLTAMQSKLMTGLKSSNKVSADTQKTVNDQLTDLIDGINKANDVTEVRSQTKLAVNTMAVLMNGQFRDDNSSRDQAVSQVKKNAGSDAMVVNNDQLTDDSHADTLTSETSGSTKVAPVASSTSNSTPLTDSNSSRPDNASNDTNDDTTDNSSSTLSTSQSTPSSSTNNVGNTSTGDNHDRQQTFDSVTNLVAAIQQNGANSVVGSTVVVIPQNVNATDSQTTFDGGDGTQFHANQNFGSLVQNNQPVRVTVTDVQGSAGHYSIGFSNPQAPDGNQNTNNNGTNASQNNQTLPQTGSSQHMFGGFLSVIVGWFK